MNRQTYLEIIEKKLSGYFDIEKPYIYRDTEYEVFAKSFIRNEKYFASKKLTIYAFENNEYTFVKAFSKLSEKEFLQVTEDLKKAAEDYVDPHKEHMSTVITGVIVVDNSLEDDFKKMVEKFSFSRSFAFGFKGWVYIRFLVVDLNKGEVISNKRGREIKKFYQVSN